MTTKTTGQSVLPEVFCWTKYGAEAGEPADEIFARKELERLANGGLFLWGIGNSLRPSVLELLTQTSDPYVCFSPMLSAPAVIDVDPPSTSLWHRGFGIDGQVFDLPEHSVVTSRTGTGTRGSRHFALVCHTEEPLSSQRLGDLSVNEIENLRTGTRLGSSQVTSVVRYRPSPDQAERRRYQVRLKVRLAPPYFVTLTDASVVPSADGAGAADRWDLLRQIRSAAKAHRPAVLF